MRFHVAEDVATGEGRGDADRKENEKIDRFHIFKKLDVFEYNLYLKQFEVSDKKSKYDKGEIEWVKKLI